MPRGPNMPPAPRRLTLAERWALARQTPATPSAEPAPLPTDPAPAPAAVSVTAAARAAKDSGAPAGEGILKVMQEMLAAAQKRGPATQSGFYVPAFDALTPPDKPGGRAGHATVPARIRETTLGDELQNRYYGADWPAVRDAITGFINPGMRFKNQAGSQAENLGAPLYEITTVPPGHGFPETVSYSRPHHIVLAPTQAARMGRTVDELRSHELGHQAAPFLMPQGDRAAATIDTPPRKGQTVWPSADRARLPALIRDSVLREYPQLADNPVILNDLIREMADSRLRRTPEGMTRGWSWPELAAHLMQMKRHEYGLTGNRMLTEGETRTAVQGWRDAPPPALGKPSRKLPAMFGNDPVYRFGPNAGQPASGYNLLLEKFRELLKNFPSGNKQDVINILRSGASTADPNARGAYV